VSQPNDSAPAQGVLAGVTWHGAVLVGIPVAFVAAFLVGVVTNVFPNESVAYGAVASLAVTGYALFWAPESEQSEKQ
jgi:MFS-type transporter involved in bile tolerance (Atg22 family)